MLVTMVEYTLHLHSYHEYMHIPSRLKSGKKKRSQGVSRKTFKGTNTTFLFFFISFPIYLLQYADLAHPEMRVLCQIVGTLNVWVSINTPINRKRNGHGHGLPPKTIWIRFTGRRFGLSFVMRNHLFISTLLRDIPATFHRKLPVGIRFTARRQKFGYASPEEDLGYVSPWEVICSTFLRDIRSTIHRKLPATFHRKKSEIWIRSSQDDLDYDSPWETICFILIHL